VDTTADMPAQTMEQVISVAPGKHVPGMGPPPLLDIPFEMPPEILAKLQKSYQPQVKEPINSSPKKPGATETDANSKRAVCNWASIMHLSGFVIVTGVLFLNIIVPTILWLLKKEQHPYLAKQGREVINFQIILTIMQLLCLGLGSFFVWLMPEAANSLFNATKAVRIVFSTAYYLPFNIFTVVPFFWGCVLMVRGTVAAYHGFSFRYPYTQAIVLEPTTVRQATPVTPKVEKADPVRVNFA